MTARHWHERVLSTQSRPSAFPEAARRSDRPLTGWASTKQPFVATGTRPSGTVRERPLPGKPVRPELGRCTSAAGCCMSSSGLITSRVVPSRHGVLNLSSTCQAALTCTRSSEGACCVM